MSRRADPVRIYLAQRAGMRSRMVEAWVMTESAADALLIAWEGEAARRGLNPLDNSFWTLAEAWMIDQRGRRR